MPSDPLVIIIVVTWNGKRDTLECLHSLRAVRYARRRTVVVDNASTDRSAEAVAEAFPEVTLLRMPSNLRFAGGNNAGIRHALAEGADRVLLLNNDTLVDQDFLTHLVTRMDADARCGMVAPLIYYADAPDTIWYAGGHVSMWTGTMRHLGIRERDRGQYAAAGPTGYATGCCVLVRREAIERAGMLDERYHIYTEDADWSLRVRTAGFGVSFEPRAKVWHKVSVSAGGHLSWFKMRNKFLSNMRFFARHARWYHWLTFPWLNLVVNGVAAGRYILTARR